MRRLLDEVGHPVRRLTRTVDRARCALRGLKPGAIRELTRDELGTLLDAARSLTALVPDSWQNLLTAPPPRR